MATRVKKSIEINPLANPKGIKLKCEICEKPAHKQCGECRSTYYCDQEHQIADSKAIHKLICSDIKLIRNPLPPLGSDEERKEQASQLRQRKLLVLNIATQQAYKYLFESQYELSIPAALQSLRLSLDLYADDSMEIVYPYLILGEACIGLKQYIQAEDYLSLAKWATYKSATQQDAIKSKIHRNFGLLYATQEKYEKGLYELALDIYHSSLATNAEDITVAGGYYHMANIFHKQRKIDGASAFYDKVVQIWDTALVPDFVLNVAQTAEAVQMLNSILSFKKQVTPRAVNIKFVIFILAKVHYHSKNYEAAQKNAMIALEQYEATMGRGHTDTVKVAQLLKNLNSIHKIKN